MVLHLFLLLITISMSLSTTAHNSFLIEESTISSIQSAFADHSLTSSQLVELYTKQIQTLNPILRSIIELNPDAFSQAKRLDRERKSGKIRSGIHGIPILIKDNIGTSDRMNTTAGSFALLGSVVGREGGVVKKLRRAGAVLLGKASLSEWAELGLIGFPMGGAPGPARERSGSVCLLVCFAGGVE